MRHHIAVGAMLGIAALAACASSGAGTPSPVVTRVDRTVAAADDYGCPPVTDTTFASVAPVYRRCAVDRPVIGIDTTFVPRGINNPAQSCVSAVVEFVVDKTGLPMRKPMKVVSTNSLDFARVLTQSIGRWRYQPAMKDGHAVRQLVQLQAAAQLGPTAGTSYNPGSFANIGPSTC